MADIKYQYEKVNAIKIILENKDGKVLLIKEPETNEWMPDHWGLPGGKSLVRESLLETFKRKAKGDIGIELEPLGIVKIEELIMQGKTAFIYHIVAKTEMDIDVVGEAADYKWVDKEDVENMDLSDFTEYFNKKFLLEYLSGNYNIFDFNIVETWHYDNMSDDLDYKRWIESGRKKSDNI